MAQSNIDDLVAMAALGFPVNDPNAVYGSAANFAAQYGYSELFAYFDYTDEGSEAWELYE